MNNYHRVLSRLETGEWVAQAYEIPWCVASGPTPTEAVRALDDLIAWALSQNRSDVRPPLQEDEWSAVVGKRPSEEF